VVGTNANVVGASVSRSHVFKANVVKPMGLYHLPDGVTNLKYKLLCFLTPNKIIFLEEGASF
jgi:hypothetical protein